MTYTHLHAQIVPYTQAARSPPAELHSYRLGTLGDTNGDGLASAPVKGDWVGIEKLTPASPAPVRRWPRGHFHLG